MGGIGSYMVTPSGVANAIINKINSLISSHNSNGNAHQDIRADIEDKEDISNKVTDLNLVSDDDVASYPTVNAVKDGIEVVSDELDDFSNKVGDIDYLYSQLANSVFGTDSVYGDDLTLWSKVYYNVLDDKLYCYNRGDVYDEIVTLYSLTNYVQKSNTVGLLKNDGTVDTTAYSTFNGNYNNLTNKPSIPSASSTTPLSDTTNGGVGTGTAWARSDHTHPKSSLYAESIHAHSIEETDLLNVLDCVNNNFDNLSSEIVFHDDCSSDMSSQYSVRGHIKEGTYPITITYVSSEPSYILSASGGESFTWFVIPNLQGLDNIRITATVMMYAPGQYTQIFLGLCDTLEQTNSSDYKFDFVRIRGDDRLDGVKNDIEQFSNNVFVSYRNVKLVFEKIGNNITGKVYDAEYGILLSWNSYTTTNEYDNPYYFLGLMSKYNAQYKLSELKAEQLII